MKRKICVFIVVIMIFCLISSCKTKEAVSINIYQQNSEIKSEDVRLSLENVKSFNPYKETNPANLKAFNLIYEPLFTYDSDMRTVGVLAESFEVSDGGKSITVRLKDNIRWHNGDELLSNDVIYTVNLILSSENLYSNGIIEKAEVIDKKTVEITFIKPQMNAPEKLMFPVIKSEDVTGTGPFKFVGKESADTYTFCRFDEYHGEKGKTNTLKMINSPDDEAIERMFDIGETDILTSYAFDYATFNASDDIKVFDYPTNELLYLGVNFDNSVFWGESTRQALLYIPDKKEITEKIMYKKALRTDFPINPESFLYPKDLECQKDNEYAEELLLKDSWTRVDGVFSRIIDESLQKFKVNMLIKDTEEMKMIAGVIEKNLDNFGIECDVLLKPEAEFYESVKNKEYDLFLDSLMLSGSQDFESLVGEGNIFGYFNSNLAQLTEKIRTEKDEEKLRLLYNECCSVLLKDVQFIPLFFYKDAVLARDYISDDIVLRLGN